MPKLSWGKACLARLYFPSKLQLLSALLLPVLDLDILYVRINYTLVSNDTAKCSAEVAGDQKQII